MFVLASFWGVAAHGKITSKRSMMKVAFVKIMESSTGILEFLSSSKISYKKVLFSKKKGNCVIVPTNLKFLSCRRVCYENSLSRKTQSDKKN